MSTVQTWTLWQRLPPRYQLTTKTFVDDADEQFSVGNASDRTFTPKKVASPRPYSARAGAPQNESRPQSRRGNHSSKREADAQKAPSGSNQHSSALSENFMLSSNVTEEARAELSNSLIQPKNAASFPKRNSDYVATFQKQRRVNSARRRFAETPVTTKISPTHLLADGATSPRAHTAPVFPVTSAETLKTSKQKQMHTTPPSQEAKPVFLRQNSIKQTKYTTEPSKVDIFQFDDAKSMSSGSSGVVNARDLDLKHSKAKKYVVQDTSRATVYIDNGKVMYFGKSRHDLTQFLKTQTLRADRGNCFLAELRRDYLKYPKYETGGAHKLRKTLETDPRRITHERVDYNRRVEHILSYYDENNPYGTPQSRPNSGQRSKSPQGSRFKGLSLTPAAAAPSRPPSRASSPVPEITDPASGDFILLNKQSKLHERQFYLRTPGMQHTGNSIADTEKCKCSMCRMELQMALVTGVGPGLKVTATNIIFDQKDTRQEGMISGSTYISRTMNRKTAGQRVTFQQPDNSTKGKASDFRVTINCKLPEVAVSESGFESSRTMDGASTCPDDVESTT
ncbi:uncharacterized protein LOC127841782 [Dreissena polymorpha]|uniref:Uncharacterized protein n=1 Tax=Dreissena polymorpha TaxID=45954 RepID=A0A9D4ET25_DREPO|nr:uncharacterized protein LOC127841782 [Dreissena polymorpha]KAH3785995.1 hypothetical protein DPMN_164093 [Dreissena polymorpha]